MTYIVKPTQFHTFLAAEALTANRLVIIDPTTDTSVRYPEADYDTQLVGITLETAASGAQVDVAVAGFVLLKVDGNVANIAWGDYIAAHGTAGYGRKVNTSAGTQTEYIGRAWEASTADNDLITVQICPGLYVVET